MADVVLSYKKADRDRLGPLIQGLEARGFTVWWDYEIETGGDWFDAILRQIDTTPCVVGVWSKNSVTSDGRFAANQQGMQYVAVEHRRAASKLAPVLLEPDSIPTEFSQFQAADLSGWTGDANHPEWLKLLARIEKLATPGWVTTRLQSYESQLEDERRRRRAAQARLAEISEQLEKETQKNALFDAKVEALNAQLSDVRSERDRLASNPPKRNKGEHEDAVSASVDSKEPSPVEPSPVAAPGNRLPTNPRGWAILLTRVIVAAFINALLGKIMVAQLDKAVTAGPPLLGFFVVFVAIGPAVVFTAKNMEKSADEFVTIIPMVIVAIGTGVILGLTCFLFDFSLQVSSQTAMLIASGLAAILVLVREVYFPRWFTFP